MKIVFTRDLRMESDHLSLFEVDFNSPRVILVYKSRVRVIFMACDILLSTILFVLSIASPTNSLAMFVS